MWKHLMEPLILTAEARCDAYSSEIILHYITELEHILSTLKSTSMGQERTPYEQI